MPNNNQAVRFISCSADSYKSLAAYDENTLYFISDSRQIFVGSKEYTKSIEVLNNQPTASTIGENGKMYVYNGNLYMCQTAGFSYVWTRIANVNDYEGTVKSVTAGAGLSGGTIDNTGTISHTVPVGAAATSDTLRDVSPAFGESFNITGVSTDEFGHANPHTHTVTLPAETPLSVSGETDPQRNLESLEVFKVVTKVEKGSGSHEVKVTTRDFKLPAEINTTYVVSKGNTDGTVLVTPSDGSAYEIEVKGWENVAKLSDISAVFTYKGSVPTIANLPANARTGDVYTVASEGNQYVYAEGSGWEKFGATIDLTPYAKKDEYVPRVMNKEGEVPKFNSDGTIGSTGFTIGKSVPADAVFTDTVYTHPTHTAHDLGLYNVQVNDRGHISNATPVTKTDITNLGIPGENTDTKVTTHPNTTNKIYLAGALSTTQTTEELQVNPSAYVNEDGSIAATAFKGNADSATKATQDEDGNSIKSTYATKTEVSTEYATKTEVENAKLIWTVI